MTEVILVVTRKLRAYAILMYAILFTLAGSPGIQVSIDGQCSSVTTTGPFEETVVWTDSFEDRSNIYIPDGGLVGVDVADGEVRLLPGYDRGWLASSVIVCPSGSHYDLIVLEVQTPGDSYLEISVLNALRAPSEIGFANETIPPFVRQKTTTLSISNLSAEMYPKIRIQVDLHAVGADKPRLLSWSLYFSGIDEWHDDFIGTSKMVDSKGINVTEGFVEINLSRRGQAGDYDPFPPVVFSGPEDGFKIFYPNSNHDGYQDSKTLSSGDSRSASIADVDGDGYPDLIGTKGSSSSTVHIFWGDESGTWSTNREMTLSATHNYRADAGDLNGDGQCDIAVACWNGAGSANSVAYLNQGDGTFNSQPDIKFDLMEYSDVDTGDLNSDGYDDIAFRL
ncbi:MAG: VCBS repeat-containing protein, partial [Methanomassiliicoccales archaeon]|nr:VCBS repeat-containing protein [Methanomassiliicoccales archaeon]